MTETLNEHAARSLGSENSYAIFTDEVDSTLLNPMPRDIVRKELKLLQPTSTGSADIWHCYEATFIDGATGKPATGILKVTIPANSPNMIESKSFKLYLNTFDMVRTNQVEYIHRIKADLSECAKADVRVQFYPITNHQLRTICNNALYKDMLRDSTIISESIDATYISREKNVFKLDNLDVTIDNYDGTYKINPAAIYHETDKSTKIYMTDALRSRCRHTKQKDTGTALIYIKGKVFIDPAEIYKYIISLRETNEFHEYCCEKIYTELKTILGDSASVAVVLFYTRRGSLDINPMRMDKEFYNYSDGIKVNLFHPYLDSDQFMRGTIIQ